MSTRISVPATASVDEVIEIKALIQHPMESGFRRGSRGEAIPRDIISKFECRYDGATIFEMDLYPGIAANPFIVFHIRATISGSLDFVWIDQHGVETHESAELLVT